jgi:hypothetical protein
MQTLKERFMDKVYCDPNSGCWIWEGYEDSCGYGLFFSPLLYGKNRPGRANRGAYMLFKGHIPDGLCVLHSCDARLCVNPDHLRLGTHAENMQDMALRGRADRRGSRLPLGVRVRDGRIYGELKVSGKTRHLGLFRSIEEAAAAVLQAKNEKY